MLCAVNGDMIVCYAYAGWEGERERVFQMPRPRKGCRPCARLHEVRMHPQDPRLDSQLRSYHILLYHPSISFINHINKVIIHSSLNHSQHPHLKPFQTFKSIYLLDFFLSFPLSIPLPLTQLSNFQTPLPSATRRLSSTQNDSHAQLRL